MSVILGALSLAGSSMGDQALKDGYAGLKALIVRKFGVAQPRLEEHIQAYSDDPDTWQKPAAKTLREAGADRDQDVLDAAVQVLKDAEAAKPGITGGLVGQINAKNVVVANRIDGGVHF
jgi:hypothetical protein